MASQEMHNRDQDGPVTVLLYGRAGCGKGTQTALLKTFLTEHDPERKALIVETGAAFREFTGENSSYTGELTKKVVERGDLPPPFISVWLWTSELVRSYTGKEHLLFDGFPRRTQEAQMLDGVFSLYGLEHVVLFVLNVSTDKATERLKLRKRADDLSEERIRRRMTWYENEVIPTINFFRHHGKPYDVIDIDGELPVEEVHRQIIGKLGIGGT